MSMQSALLSRFGPELVRSGQLPAARLDDAVRRVLSVKAKLGLFRNPYRSLNAAPAADGATLRATHEALAREAARRSMVLLKNERAVLPLRAAEQRIALLGPFASDRSNLAGCWDLFGDAARGISLESGLREALTDPARLLVERGCDIEESLAGGIERAVTAALAADVVVLAIGEPSRYSGEAQSRTQIVVPPVQQALVAAVRSTGKPLVIVLRTGRALALTGAVREADAILVAWFLGSQTGTAVADVLCGTYNPAGRLPVSFPIDSGQQPFYYNRPPTGRPHPPGSPRDFTAHWREVPQEALYPFGHGISYTQFRYGPTRLSTHRLKWDDRLTISADITNVGRRAGEEVVQLYVRDPVASRARPIRELKGFIKLALAAGETRTASFQLARGDLAFRSTDNRLASEPGRFDVWIAPSSNSGNSVSFVLLGPDEDGVRGT